MTFDRTLIEGVGGKRALSLLPKSELCQKRSKFRMQFCLGASNNVLCFFAEVCLVFKILHMQKKPVFVATSACECKDGNVTYM